MSELLEIIISAVDQASDVFQGIGDTVNSSADEIRSQFEQATAEVDRLTEELAAIYMGDVEGDAEAVESALAAAEAEAERLGQALDNVEQEGEETKDSLDGMADLMAFQQISEWVGQLADKMWELADKAGTVQDSWTRMGLAAEGAHIPVDQMKDSVSELSGETGRAGGSIRESFIAMSSAGVTNMDAMKSAFRGASAQSFILGTDVDSLVNKFSGMAMKSSVAERTLKGTGITVEELGNVLGIQGATIDDVNAKWGTMDTNARMAALGQASAMNEGKDANEAYKNSWEGLQAQIDIAKGKIEVLAGKVFLPVLVPAMEAAAGVLDWLGNTIGAVMDGPLGGLISVIGSLGGGLILLLGGITAVSAGMGFFSASLLPAIASSWALLAPWLPFIAIGAAVVAVIYEIGKAFGWWNDASGMISAIGAGLQRLWDAFINHPDVQAAIEIISGALQTLWSWITQAWNALMNFFGVATGGNFDIVAALIQGIGDAWNAVTTPIKAVIGFVQQVIQAFDMFRAGQIDLPTFIMTVLQALVNMYRTIFNMIVSIVNRFFGNMIRSAVSGARNFVNSIINWLRQLPGRVYSALASVVGRIRSAIQAWIGAAVGKVHELISKITSPFQGVAGSISSALGGVANALLAPFKQAWAWIEPYYNKIKGALDWVTGHAQGGESAMGGEPLIGSNTSYTTGSQSVDVNHNITLDLVNVPAQIDTNTLISMLRDPTVLRALTSSPDFQSLDAKVKERLNLKQIRARGR